MFIKPKYRILSNTRINRNLVTITRSRYNLYSNKTEVLFEYIILGNHML